MIIVGEYHSIRSYEREINLIIYVGIDIAKLTLMDLKALGRFRQKMIKQRTRLKIQLTTYVNQIFPGLQYFFKSGLHQNAFYDLLKEAPSPNEIVSMYMTLWQICSK